MKYFDYAASCPLDRDAAELYMKAATEHYGNSQSLHDIGGSAETLLENCRKEWAKMLKADRNGIFFTSGGSESNLLTIMALLSANKEKGRHIVTGQAEHSSVFNLIKKFEQDGYEVTFLPLNSDGIIDLKTVEEALREDTVLVSIQHGNSEIGTLQPIEPIGSLCKDRGILFHSDCVQTFGKVDIDSLSLSVDALTISGHKFYGPKGTGVAYLNPRVPWRPFIEGTTHEHGFRPGTVNVPGILATTAAGQKAFAGLKEERKHLMALRELLMSHLGDAAKQMTVFGLQDERQLPGIVGLAIKGIEGQSVMLECNRNGFAISTGSACHTDLLAPSKTMTAMGISGKQAKEFFRISFGRQTAENDVIRLANVLSKMVLNHAN